MINTVKGFSIAELDVLEFSCFFHHPTNVANLIAASSAFSKSSLNIWKFMGHVLLKPGLENFEHYFTSMWDECSCVVVWAFFVIALFGIGMKTDLFQSGSFISLLKARKQRLVKLANFLQATKETATFISDVVSDHSLYTSASQLQGDKLA